MLPRECTCGLIADLAAALSGYFFSNAKGSVAGRARNTNQYSMAVLGQLVTTLPEEERQ
jgi:hypothetical protein